MRTGRKEEAGWHLLLAASALAGGAALAPATLAQQPARSQAVMPNVSGCERVTATLVRLTIGRCVLSTLGEDDATDGRSRYEDYSLLLHRGEAVRIDLDSLPVAEGPSDPGAQNVRSYGFDTFLEVRREAGGEPLEVNDDRPNSLNSTLVFVAPERGIYVVRARAFGTGLGDYVLRTTVAPSPRPQVRIWGDTIAGTLEIDGWSEDSYVLEGHEGERLRLVTETRNLQVDLLDSGGRTVASAFPASESLSHLLAVLPRHDLYTVRVAGESAHQRNPFTIRVERAMPPPAEQPESIAVGQSLERALTIASAAEGVDPNLGEAEYFYDLYEVRAPSDRPFTITAEGIDEFFDPVLEVGTMTRLGLSVLLSDDDGGGGWNSRLVVPAPHPDSLIVRVRSFDFNTGRYRISLAEGETPRPAAAR